jgi:hypothetical protein
MTAPSALPAEGGGDDLLDAGDDTVELGILAQILDLVAGMEHRGAIAAETLSDMAHGEAERHMRRIHGDLAHAADGQRRASGLPQFLAGDVEQRRNDVDDAVAGGKDAVGMAFGQRHAQGRLRPGAAGGRLRGTTRRAGIAAGRAARRIAPGLVRGNAGLGRFRIRAAGLNLLRALAARPNLRRGSAARLRFLRGCAASTAFARDRRLPSRSPLRPSRCPALMTLTSTPPQIGISSLYQDGALK